MNVDEIAYQLASLELWQLYLGYTVLLMVCGVGAPLNSDLIILTSAGLLATEESVPLGALIFFGWLGITTGDSLAFVLAKAARAQGGRFPLIERWLEKRISAWVEAFILSHGGKGLILARFLPGTRTATILSASFLGLPFRHFLLYNAGTLLFYVPILHLTGRYAGQSLRRSLESGEVPLPFLLGGLAVVMSVLGLSLLVRQKRAIAGED